jgi:hypothetical protein
MATWIFFAERLANSADMINRAAGELWPHWSKPNPLERADRQRRKDEESPRKMRRAAFLFAGAMLAVFAAIAWVIIVGEDSATTSLAALSVFVGVLLVIGASINLGYRFLIFKLSYRCPQCRSKSTRVDEALPAIHYYCPACNIEWDTGLETQRVGLGD